jgi:hypothetical protein
MLNYLKLHSSGSLRQAQLTLVSIQQLKGGHQHGAEDGLQTQKHIHISYGRVSYDA